jgi:choline dehydrogenase-like flavoprotein
MPTFEYIVVGSGAGGGTVAARLAEAGRLVLLLEAGGDPWRMAGTGPLDPGENRLPEDYRVPAFHAISTENDALKWDFWVRHLDEHPEQDPKYYERYPRDTGDPVRGVWYPRAGTLGGCTAHNAMILICPHNRDWDDIAARTGDASWSADRMRAYFERLEDCRHRRRGTGRHGFDGWLTTEKPDVGDAARDLALAGLLCRSADAAGRAIGQPGPPWLSRQGGDPNDWSRIQEQRAGVGYLPLTTRDARRRGTRERLKEVQDTHPDRLTIELDALVTRVVLDGTHRAVGVEYLKGRRLYRAHAVPSDEPGTPARADASREVILAGGAFNTPQLLMLSGIGPPDELRRPGIGIDVKVPLEGVGRNLQDRYEVTVVNRMTSSWKAMTGAAFRKGDDRYREWVEDQEGVYATNGSVMSVIARSSGLPADRPPDMFYFPLVGRFTGYYPHYTAGARDERRYLTWGVLKGQTRNRGRVRLASPDPRDRPDVHFHYFDPAQDPGGLDLDAVVEGVRFARELSREAGALFEAEEAPGPQVQTTDQLRSWVRSHAWGHHASCTCPIGADADPMAVLDHKFRVRHTTGLRVVDASVFPSIPGFFIVSAVYIAAEKAADDILADADRV